LPSSVDSLGKITTRGYLQAVPETLNYELCRSRAALIHNDDLKLISREIQFGQCPKASGETLRPTISGIDN
jgi:hypothetical protein